MSFARREARVDCFLRGIANLSEAEKFPCLIHDLSEHGARISFEPPVNLPDQFTLDIPRRHLSERVKVVRRGEDDFGLVFLDVK